MPYDGGDLYIKVDLLINGVYVEVTSRARGGRAASGVEIERGRGTGAIQAEASRCTLTLGNPDGYVTEGNAFSPWYPYIGRGCGIRVSLSGIAVSDVVRFEGEIDTMVAVYPGGSDSSMRITATGILGGQLALGADPARSPMFRTMSGIAVGDATPWAYWALEDGADSTFFGSGLSGPLPMTLFGAIELATSDAVAGSLPLPVWQAGSKATGIVPDYTDTGTWSAQATVIAPEDLVTQNAAVTVFNAQMAGGTYGSVSVGITPGSQLALVTRDRAGTVVDSWSDTFPTGSVLGTAVTVSVTATDAASDEWAANLIAADGTILASISQTSGAGHYGKISKITVNGLQAQANNVVIGHVGVWVDPLFTSGVDDVANAAAINGYVGELAHDRVDRLCREAGITVTITGTSQQAMGVQEVDTLTNLLIDAEGVDNGLLSDGGSGLDFRASSSLYNQDVSLAVTIGALDTDVAPIWDNRHIRNDVTVSRSGGSSARRTDEDHIERTRRRLPGSGQANVETDGQLPHQAGWQVNVGTAPGPRYNGVGINLRNEQGRLLADAVLDLEAGDRFTVAAAALPPQHPPGGIDALVIGWSELLDKDKWVFAPNCVDYSPYLIGVYGTDPGGVVSRYGARNTVLAEDLTTTETAADVTATGETWATTATHPSAFPFNVDIGGLTYSCTGITGTTPNYTLTLVRLTTDKTHSTGAQVTVTDTGRYAI